MLLHTPSLSSSHSRSPSCRRRWPRVPVWRSSVWRRTVWSCPPSPCPSWGTPRCLCSLWRETCSRWRVSETWRDTTRSDLLSSAFVIVSAGLCWFLMVSNGLCRSLLVSNGLCWFLMVSNGLCRSLLVSNGLCWSLMVSDGLWWTLLSPLVHGAVHSHQEEVCLKTLDDGAEL